MRSLVITPTPTHPTHQGNRARVAQIATALRRRGPVEILYSAIDGAEPETLAAMRDAWDGVHVVPPVSVRPRRAVPSHWGVDEWVAPQLVVAARALAATTRYDVVVANYVWCSLLLECFDAPGTVRVLDTHDVFADRHGLARAAGLSPHWFHTTAAEEARGLARADVVLAIQPAEAAHFARLSAAPVRLLEYAPPPVTLPPRADGGRVVGYFGSANPWNVASLTAFDRLLATREGFADARFLLLGGITRAIVAPRVFQPAGTVADVADAYAAIDLVVNPMVGGTGLKIKTVEALAHGRAVLATRDGGAGLEALGPDLALADPTALADRLARVLARPGGIAEVAARQAPRYAAFQAGVAARLAALVDGWAVGWAVGAGGGR